MSISENYSLVYSNVLLFAIFLQNIGTVPDMRGGTVD